MDTITIIAIFAGIFFVISVAKKAIKLAFAAFIVAALFLAWRAYGAELIGKVQVEAKAEACQCADEIGAKKLLDWCP